MGNDTHLISFLGIGDYKETCYGWEGMHVTTRYVALALAKLFDAGRTRILATEEAEDKHTKALRRAFLDWGLAEPDFVRIPSGGESGELWEQFRILREQLDRGSQSSHVLDITHGFRAQPFFASAVVSFLRALPESASELKVVYGAWEARRHNVAPIWDLTVFTDLVDWAHAVGHFLRTGDAGSAVERTERIGREADRVWAASKEGAAPTVLSFARALREFSDALVTVRVGELLLRREKGDKPTEGPARVEALLEALQRSREDLSRHVPPMAEVLERVESVLRPLSLGASDLSGPEAASGLAALARLYWELGRYAEAAAVLREAWVNRYAHPSATRPGSTGCSSVARKKAEDAWRQVHPNHYKTIAANRNDIEHAGFRSYPLPPNTIRKQLDRLIRDLETAEVSQQSEAVRTAPRTAAGTVYFVSRHPGAREWALSEGSRVDRVLEHLDLREIVAGDIVIGSLPVNLAAEVCARGAHYHHLSLELPQELRGVELSAEQMRDLGARIEEFCVERVGSPAKDP